MARRTGCLAALLVLATCAPAAMAKLEVEAAARWGEHPLIVVRGRHIDVRIAPTLGGRILHVSRPGGPGQLRADESLANFRPREGAIGEIDYGGIHDRVTVQRDKLAQDVSLWRAAFTPLVQVDKGGQLVHIVLQLTRDDLQVTRRIEIDDDVPRLRVHSTYHSVDPDKAVVRQVELLADLTPGGSADGGNLVLAGRPEGVGLLRCGKGSVPSSPMPAPRGWWGVLDGGAGAMTLFACYAGEAGRLSVGVAGGAVRARSVFSAPPRKSGRRDAAADLVIRYDLWLLAGRDELAALTEARSMLAAADRKPTRQLLELLLDRRPDIARLEEPRCTLAEWGLFVLRVPGPVWGLSPAQSVELRMLPFGAAPRAARLDAAVTPLDSKRAEDLSFPQSRFDAAAEGVLRLAAELPPLRPATEAVPAQARWTLKLQSAGAPERTVPLAAHAVMLVRSPATLIAALGRRDRSPHRTVWATAAWRLRELSRPIDPSRIEAADLVGLDHDVRLLDDLLKDPKELSHRTGAIARALGDEESESPAAGLERLRPFTLHVPRTYEPTTAAPLAVVLSESGADDNAAVWQTAAEHAGCIVLAVPPRPGEPADVYEILARDLAAMVEVASADYAIDAKKISLTGCGDGGTLAWLLASRYPDRWSAVCPVGARTVSLAQLAPAAAAGPLWRRLSDARADILGGLGGLANVPVCIYHSYDDTHVPVSHSALAASRLATLQVDCRFNPFATLGHGVGPQLAEDILTFLTAYERMGSPRVVSVRAVQVDQGAAWWLRIGRFDLWGRPAAVRAQVKDRQVNLSAENCAQLTLALDDDLFAGKGGPVTVNINGTPVIRWSSLPRAPQGFEKDAKGNWAFQARLRPPQGNRKEKGPHLAGPVRDALLGPFVAVYGAAVEAETEVNRAEAEALVAHWRRLGVACRAEADKDHRRAPEGPHLVLIGTPASNAALAQLIGRLDVAVGPDGVKLDGRLWTGEGLGLVAVRPHPQSDDRYVVLMTAPTVAGIRGISARPADFDYCLFDKDTTADPATAVRFGWLDGAWQTDPRCLYGREIGRK